MGGAAEEAMRSERSRDEAHPVATTVVKWRVRQRVLPPTAHDLVLSLVDAEKLHPLTTTSTAVATIEQHSSHDDAEQRASTASLSLARSLAPSKVEPSVLAEAPPLGAMTEVVALEEGELDPLGAFAMGLSPSAGAGSTRSKSVATTITQRDMSLARETAPFGTIKHQWTAHKDRVLAKLSDETFAIKAIMLETNDMEGELSYSSASDYQRREHEVPVTSATDGVGVIRKSRARLEQLERRQSSSSTAPGSSRSLGKNSKTVEITQQEYVARIKQMQADLVKAWQQNMKVQALRIAIKCVKQLSDTSSAPQLYPLAFVLVSDVLDEFGGLVFERIKARASEDENGQPLQTPLSEKFTSDEVNIHAKETCRNWFYKTACIRELLPRIYIEIALLKSYRFLGDGEFPQIVARLSNMIKGVGEPMVALYTRLYLALASTELVSPSEKTAVLSSLYDYFFAFQQYQDQGKLVRFLEDQKLQHDDYFALHSPAVEWLMKCTAHGAPGEVFEGLLEQYKEYSDNSMVLKHLCESFGAAGYAANPLDIFHLMRTASPSQYSKCHLYSVLAIQLSNTSSIGSGNKDTKLRFLNEAWSSITAQEDIEAFMECAAAYMKLIVAHFTHREATILLKDVMRHLNSATPQELTPKVYNLLGAFIENVVYGAQQHTEFFTRLIPSGEFLSLMGMFRREASVGVAKKVLQAFVNASGEEDMPPSKHNTFGNLRLHVVGPEAAVAHTLFVICCRVHDALDSLSTMSERNEATKDIVAFISRLGYAKNSSAKTPTLVARKVPTSDAQLQEEEEALLMLYIDCRSAFYKLEPIKSFLTKYVIALAMRVRQRMVLAKGKNGILIDDRRRDFIKSCLAYAHITIPSIVLPFSRLELLVVCAKAALISKCLPQMEALLKSAIVVIADLDYVQVVSGVEGSTSLSTDTVSLLDSSLESVDVPTDPVFRVAKELVALVAYAPSTMDDEPCYFVEALRKALLERMTWVSATSSAPERVRRAAVSSKIRTMVALAELYAMWSQSRFPTRLEGVESNDVLYGGEDTFHQQAMASFSALVEQLVRDIEALSEPLREPSTDWELAFTQVDLLVGLVQMLYPYLSLDEPVSSDEPTQEEPSVSDSGRQRATRSRSGAVLLRKCLLFANDRLQCVVDSCHHEEKTASRAQVLSSKFVLVTQALADYVLYQQKTKAPLYSSSARHALDALEASLSAFAAPVR